MSFNPSTGLVYIPTSTNSTNTFALDPNFTYKPGERNIGIIRGNRGTGLGVELPPQPAPTLPPPPAVGPFPPGGQRGMLVAWDPVTQRLRWRTPGGGSIGGGTVTTAGNLVFQVIPDGRFVAYTADKGEKLLEIQSGLRGGMGPPITYMLDGKQYVSFLGGQGTLPPPLLNAPPPPGTVPTGPTVPPRLLTFVLDGKGLLPSQ